MWDEAWERANFCEHANLVDLLDDGVEDFSFEWAEDNRFIFDWVDDEALAGLNYSASYVDDRCDGNYKAILSRARSLHLGVEFLPHSV